MVCKHCEVSNYVKLHCKLRMWELGTLLIVQVNIARDVEWFQICFLLGSITIADFAF